MDISRKTRYHRHRLIHWLVNYGSISVLKSMLYSKYANGRYRIPMKHSKRLWCLTTCASGTFIWDVDYTFWSDRSDSYDSDGNPIP
jgi:hypothetical protein